MFRNNLHMNITRFSAPPLPLDASLSLAKNITIINEKLPHHGELLSDNNSALINNKNVIAKKRVLRLGVLKNFRNSVDPQDVCANHLPNINSPHVAEHSLKMTKEMVDNEDDDIDVVCAKGVICLSSVSSASCNEKNIPQSISHLNNEGQIDNITNITQYPPSRECVAVQTYDYERIYMLRILPILKNIYDKNPNENIKASSKIWKNLRLVGRLCFCQLGLAWILTFWTVAGGAAFHATEGPRERDQVYELKAMQKNLAIGLAMELSQIKSNDEQIESLWNNKVNYYMTKHEKLLLAAVSAGYGEGGDTPGGRLWTFPGCILFAISLTTTLGFGAPVPRTTLGRSVTIVFAAFGIPAHFLLVFNLGLLLAVRLQSFAIHKRLGAKCDADTLRCAPIPKWVKAVPFICILSYYIIGIVTFGIGRSRPVAASLLFPLDFTVGGGLANTTGLVRILYGLYLEGAVTIATMTIAVLRVSATRSLTNIGLKYNLLIEV